MAANFVPLGCSSAEVNFEVRSMATPLCCIPDALPLSYGWSHLVVAFPILEPQTGPIFPVSSRHVFFNFYALYFLASPVYQSAVASQPIFSALDDHGGIVGI